MGTKNRPIYEPRFAGLGLMTFAADGVRASIGPAGPSDASIRAIVAPNGSSDASSRASGVPTGSLALIVSRRKGFARCAAGSARTLGSKRPKAFFIDLGVFSRL